MEKLNLATMDRDTLYALDSYSVIELANENQIDTTYLRYDKDEMAHFVRERTTYSILLDLDTLRIELQQEAAEQTVEEMRQSKLEYARASAKINPKD